MAQTTVEDQADGRQPQVSGRLSVIYVGASQDAEAVAGFRWEGPTEAWTVRGTIVRKQHGLDLRDLILAPRGNDLDEYDCRTDWDDNPKAPGIDFKLLRSLPLEALMAEVQLKLVEEAQKVDAGIPGVAQTPQDQWLVHIRQLASEPAARRPGRPKLPDSLLRDVAMAYLAEIGAGRGLMRRMSVRFDKSPETVRDWVYAARKAGFLGPAQHGRRSASPGPRLLADR